MILIFSYFFTNCFEGSSSSQSKSSGVFIAQNRNSVVSTANSAYNSADTTVSCILLPTIYEKTDWL